MAVATLSPDTERELFPFCAVVNKLKRRGILTDVLVAATLGVTALIADVYAALRSGTIELYRQEDLMLVRRFEQHVLHMQKRGLINDTIAAALTTVNTASAATDLRYLVSSVLTNTNLDATSEASAGFELNYAYPVTR